MKVCTNETSCYQAEKFLSTTLGSESGVNAIFTNGRVNLSLSPAIFFVSVVYVCIHI